MQRLRVIHQSVTADLTAALLGLILKGTDGTAGTHLLQILLTAAIKWITVKT